MSLGIVPVVAFVVVLIFSGSSDSSAKSSKARFASDGTLLKPGEYDPSDASVSSGPMMPPVEYPASYNDDAERPSQDSHLDYQAIRNYISTSFKAVQPQEVEAISQYLVDYGKKHEIDPKLAAALIARESGFNRTAVSRTGAKGLGQIKDFNMPSLNIQNPFDAKENVGGTTAYLKKMLQVWKDKSQKVSLAVASYYKGHNAVKRDNGLMDNKTSSYVKDILKNYERLLSIRTGLLSGSGDPDSKEPSSFPKLPGF